MFTHLHAHSYYSFLDGLASPADLAHAAARSGMQAMALTDTNGLSGAVEFFDACKAIAIWPILGLELKIAPPLDMPSVSASQAGGLVLLATDLSGWRSLCRLSSKLLGDHAANPDNGLPFETLSRNTEGLICLTGGNCGLTARLIQNSRHLSAAGQAAAPYLQRLSELFPGRVYIELQKQAPLDSAWVLPLASLAVQMNLPVVVTQDIHYLSPGQANVQRLLTALRSSRPLSEIPLSSSPLNADFTSGLHFTTEMEMKRRFADLPEPVLAAALENTRQVAERCQLELPVGIPHHPEVPLPPGTTPIQLLRQKAETGACELYGKITAALQSRLEHELTVIGERGYASLFLIMEEIVKYARQKGVPISSRGSAASSLVAHCLGITSPDPIRLNLYFERFLNPVRATPPDIDTDLCSRRRDDVIRFVYDRYGADRVAMVCTVNRFRRRSALREVAKAYGLPSAEIKAMADSLPQRWWGPPTATVAPDLPYAELTERYNTRLHQSIFQDANAILGIPRHLSIHPGGVVISPGPLTDLVPTLMAAKGVVITQFDLDAIERLGLVKIDLLGIRGLTVLGDVVEAVHSHKDGTLSDDPSSINGSSIYGSSIDLLEAIPEDDRATAELVRSGRTIGCFQIESPGMQATLKEIQASSIDDIMVALALYRPGPLTGGLKDDYVRRHRRQDETVQLHPSLEPLLKDTYGVILYQEQVLRIAHELAGLDLVDADLLRRAMSHFDPGKQMQALKERFISGAYSRSSVPEEVGERIWQLMAAFAGYGFPKAHAASYAQVAWRIAWCKAHFPAEFMAAVLANWGGYYGQRIYLTEARRLGLTLRPPHINFARPEFSVSYIDGEPALFMGLNQVRELTRRTLGRILRGRPFSSLADFLARADPRPVEAENLVQAGALEGLGRIPAMLQQLRQGGWRGGQLPLFSFSNEQQDDWTLKEQVAAQEAFLGAGIAAHPLEFVARQIAEAGALSTVEAAGRVGQKVRVAGMRQTWRRKQTTRGDYVYFMSLEDLQGMLDVVIFADVYRRSHSALKDSDPCIVEGVIEIDHRIGEPFIRAEKIWRLE